MKGNGKVTAGDVMAALAKRYKAPEFALLSQVGNGTGYGVNRWADAMAMSLWPSRGLDLHGFEVKVYRSDWQRELRKPEKADEIAPFCDFWWVAAAPGVVKLDEMPMPWGLLELDGRGLVTVKQAERRTPQPIDRSLLAAILRRASEDTIPKSAIASRIEAAREEGRKQGEDRANLKADTNDAAGRTAIAAIEAFERTSGVKIDGWNGARQGRAFKLAMQLGEDGALSRLGYIKAGLQRIMGEIETLEATSSPEGT